MDKEKVRDAAKVIFVGCWFLSTASSIMLVHEYKKKIKKYQATIDVQHQMIRWVAENAAAIDREEFLKEFEEKAHFLNIVYTDFQ